VADDVQQFLVPQRGGESEETVYVPMAQAPRQAVTLVVRTRADPRAHAELIRTEIWKINPDVTINTVETMAEFASKYTVALDVLTAILGGFSVFALLLASLGTYGVVAYSVGQRTHEIGVRLAVGARPREVVAMIAMHGVKMSLVGMAGGALLLLPVVALMGSVLEGFALAPVEPLRLVAATLVLFVVTLAASVVPATRAANVDPVLVLKAE